MSVHYKLKNTIAYEPVKFDGVYISASDLKSIIVQQKKLVNCELQVENEETGQQYSDDQMIPKNTNIIVSRLPIVNSNKRTRLMASQPYPTRFSGNANSAGSTGNHHKSHHHHHNHHNNNRHNLNSVSNSNAGGQIGSSSAPSAVIGSDGAGGGREAMELVSTKTLTEEEKKKRIQSQSTQDFDPARYARSSRGGGLGGRGGRGGSRGHFVPGPGYTCNKCGIPGHSIYDCKSNAMTKVKRSSGIPRDFLMKVDSKEKGALMTPSGEYAVPYIDREAYNNPKVEKAPFFEDGTPSDETISATATAATKKFITTSTATTNSSSTTTRNREVVAHTK